MLVGVPSLAIATAWFAPLPPWKVWNFSPETVSPGVGIRSTLQTRSRLTLPTTTMCFPPIGCLLLFHDESYCNNHEYCPGRVHLAGRRPRSRCYRCAMERPPRNGTPGYP